MPKGSSRKVVERTRGIGHQLRGPDAWARQTQQDLKVAFRRNQDKSRRKWRKDAHTLKTYVVQVLSQTNALGSSEDVPMDVDQDSDYHDVKESEAYQDVVTGKTCLEISHAGDESGLVISRLAKGISDTLSEGRQFRRNTCSHSSRTEAQTLAFAGQIGEMITVYGHFMATRGTEGFNNTAPEALPTEAQATQEVTVVDAFGGFTKGSITKYACNKFTASAFVREGLIPSVPFKPGVAVIVHTMELFRRLHNHSPCLLVQAFSTALCDMDLQPSRRHFKKQLTICYDIFISLVEGLEKRVKRALNRDSPDWRLANACASCLYVVQNEPLQDTLLLLTGDGNNSIVRMKNFRVMPVNLDKAKGDEMDGEAKTNDGDEGSSGSKCGKPGRKGKGGKDRTGYDALDVHLTELLDTRDGRGDYFIQPVKVEKFKKDPMKNSWKSTTGKPDRAACEDRWHNMVNDVASKAWGIYKKTGIFVLLCRHDMMFMVADMIESGELAVYPLTLIERLLEVIKLHKIVIGYNCGCKFKKALARSMLGPVTKDQVVKFVVGLFHGHAHNRVGLNAFENCESYFSKLNALAPVVRHSLTFHQHQTVWTYMQHMDEVETFQRWTITLYNDVKHALEIIANRPVLLTMMQHLGVKDTNEFYEWLDDERQYLRTLHAEPEEDSLRVEYYKALTAWHNAT
ncbi:hypothetical protein CPB85DRAFT_1441633 [Mucidula mucida]|nr:hypothetical protein CPB85DRAFT_1441633 [Mucidula mucida]